MRKRLFAFLGLILAVVLLAACGETTKKHKVTFDVNGGTPAIAAVEVEEGKLVAKPADPTKAGYNFAGWYLGDAAWNFETDKVTKPITLVAKWDEQGPTLYTVTFNTDGGRPLIDSEEVPAGEKVLKPARIPYKEHYVFKGWYVGNEKFDFENTAINSDITITAKWEKMAEVVFDVRGGSAIDPLYVEKGKKVTKPEDPTREGYNFLGWLLDGQAYDFDAVVEDDLLLVASWEEKEYVTITLIADGGEPAPESPVQHEKGTVFLQPAAMTKAGYDFDGWYLGDERYNFNLPVESNLILIAKWTRVYANYTVTFDIGYEGGEEIDAQTVQEEDKATEPTVEDRAGYRLMGWFEEGATEPYDFDAMVLGDLHLVAQWHLEHVVTFDIGYAEGTNPAPVLVLDGDKVSAPSIAAREFYQFDGWFLGEATEPFDFAETPITETIHLVARWTELETYGITYHNATDDMFVYGTKEAMVEAFLLDFYDFVKSPFSISDFMHGPGKTSGFDGLWNEANDKIYGGPRPEPGAYNDTYFVSSYKYMDKWLPFFDMIHEFVLIVNPDQFFFGGGVWTGKIRLRQYICNIRPGGKETAEDMYMMPDPLISNPPVKQHLGTDAIQLLEPYREDATFLGWYDNAELTGDPITEIPANTKEDKNVYAKWDEMERFDVTFDIGYAEGESPAAQSVIEGHKATKPADPARRPGYRFEGWFEDAAEEAFNFDNPITAAVALTAKWREVTEYQVTFDYNTPNVEDVILWLEDGELIVEPAEPAREGYRFLGWYEGEAENPYNFTVAPTADTVLTAKWEIYTIYTITYNVPAEAEVAPGFAERNEMVDAFLTDFYNFLVFEEVIDGTAISLSDYMHGTGKTEGYDGIYASNDHGALKLYGVVEGFANLEVQPETGLFINQVEYNKWVPLMLLWEEYVSKGNPAQSMLGNASVPGSPSLIQYRLKPFLRGINLWGYAADIILPILATIPKEYAAAKYEYTLADGEFYLPQAIHATKEFIGWYDNEELTGDPIELVAEGTTGNLVFYGAFGTRYNVEYHLGYDELQLPKAVVLEGNLVPNKEVEPRHLYKFLGWALQGETELFDFETIITEDIVLVAQWEALEALTVTFDLGYEGAPLPEEVEVGKGTAVAKPTPDPIREGYIFGGWYLGEATDPYDFATLVEANMTLTARWEEYHTITFNLGEGGYLSNEDLIAHVDNNHIVATRYSNAGDSTGKPIMVGPNSGAYWYKIALKDTATPGVYEVINKGGGSSYSLPTETTLVVAYHDSVAGDYAAAIKAIYASIEAGALVLIPELPAAYASETVIDIYFLSGALPTEVVVISNEITELITPLREGYNFVNWYDNAELTGDPITTVPILNVDVILYPKWEAKVYHTVTFDAAEGLPAPAAQQVEEGLAATEPADPAKDDHLFLGWYLGEAEEAYDFTTPVTGPITLTAKYRLLENLQVTFDLGYADAPAPTVVDVKEFAKVARPEDPLRDGYVFENWYVGEATDPYDFNTAVTANLTLTARWIEGATVTVTFNLGYEGSPAATVETILQGTAVAAPADPAREGYQFEGWFEGEATDPYDFATLVEANLVLTAKWLLIETYAINYELNGGAFLGDYANKNALLDAFLTDFHTYLESTDSLSDFMHGVGKTEGYAGLWYSANRAKIYNGPRPEAVDEAYFISAAAYMDKWLPFFDFMEYLVNKINTTQHFYDVAGKTYTGLLRLSQYMKNDPVRSQHAEVPGEYFPVKAYQNISDDITLVEPVRDGYIFDGWYDNPEFTGEPIVTIVKGSTGNLTLYAKWTPDVQLPEMIINWDFGTVAKIGYAAGDLTWTNGDSTEVTANKDRAQINTSDYAPHNGEHFLILSIRDTASEAWIELDFTTLTGMNKISFEINVWNNSLLATVKDTPNGLFILQVKDGENWVNVQTTNAEANLLPLLTFEEYVEVAFDVDGPGLYRIMYSGTSTATNNTTTAVTVDNLKVFK